MGQFKSSFFPNGRTKYDRVAEIFFRTNDRKLDRQDSQVLEKVGNFVRGQLALGKQPELYLIAETDSRGSDKHNKWLSDKRLKVVTDFLGKSLSNEPRFKYVWALSVGEELTVQPSREYDSFDNNDRTDRMYQRRVRIYQHERLFRTTNGTLDYKRYELRRGFVKESPRVEIKMDQLPGGFSW